MLGERAPASLEKRIGAEPAEQRGSPADSAVCGVT